GGRPSACDSPRRTQCGSCASCRPSCPALVIMTPSKPSALRAMASRPSSFAECWDRQARERGDQPAISDRRWSLSWREASDLSRLLARGLLALGSEPGAVVGCWLPNWVELYLLRVACERAGLI